MLSSDLSPEIYWTELDHVDHKCANLDQYYFFKTTSVTIET